MAVAVVVLTATSASAAGPGTYQVSATGGATFSQFSSNNLVSGIVDDQLFYLSTTGSGINRLPFPLRFYNQTYQNIAISSNGNVQPGITSGGTASFTNNCLTSATFGRSAVLTFWDDLYFNSNDTSNGFTEGIFLRTSGAAPNRRFTVSWQGHLFGSTGAVVLAQAIFREGSQTIQFVYGRSGGGAATIGTQAKQQLSSTQWSCNSGSATTVVAGQRLTFLHFG